MDDFIFFKENGGEEEWFKNEKIRIAKEELKVDDFIQKVLAFERSGIDSYNIASVLMKKIGGVMGGTTDKNEIFRAIKARNENVINAIKACSFEELGAESEVVLTKQQMCEITGEAYVEEAEKEKVEEDEPKEEEEREVFLIDGFGKRYRRCQLE